MILETCHYFYVYILTNAAKDRFETGVTGDLLSKLNPVQEIEHGNNLTAVANNNNNNGCRYLVHFEPVEDPLTALKREEQIRAYSRKKKLELIDNSNPEWRFLNDDFALLGHLATRVKS